MKPTERFEGWIDWFSWGLCLAIDIKFRRIWAVLGPLHGAINWGRL